MQTIQKKQNTYYSIQELVFGYSQFSLNLEILLSQQQTISQKIFKKINNFQVLCATLSTCKNLISFKIDLSLCYFGKEEISSIIEGLKNCQQLKKISLFISQAQHKNQEIVGDQIISAFFKLRNLLNIQDITLDLSKNNIQASGAKDLGYALEQLRKLKILSINLSQNSVQDKGATLLSISISKCKYISFLSLNFLNNKINDQNMKKKINQRAKKMKRVVRIVILI
ncbi:hypothetical protein ABPG72_009321 [Tetrahymena utriculariae]